MTTTEAIAFRIQANTLKDGCVGLDPLTILALVQVLAQVLQSCFAAPEDALAYLRCDDLRGRPVLRLIRQRRISGAIGRQCSNLKLKGVRIPEVRSAALAEIDTLTVDQIADLFADISR